jgi:starvation-inducible DNA-binding protein
MADAALQVSAAIEHPETGIEEPQRLAKGLKGLLADTYVLLIKTQGYHWNVVGPLFVSIHELTEQHYQDLFDFPAPSSLDALLKATVLKEDHGEPTAAEMIRHLVRDHETMVQRLRQVTEIAEERHDQVTADLLTERMTFHEKAIWMLRAIITE